MRLKYAFISSVIPFCEPVVLADETISRQQFRLRFREEGVEVEDLQSACGTFVDGRQVSRAMLTEGGEIAVGDFVVRVVRG
ncbi:MAG: FHA domain-containing protein [Sphingobacteriales bacterium]|nr:MAG: FHA domain-containing protein [Sphingobacteriales bacterium]